MVDDYVHWSSNLESDSEAADKQTRQCDWQMREERGSVAKNPHYWLLYTLYYIELWKNILSLWAAVADSSLW